MMLFRLFFGLIFGCFFYITAFCVAANEFSNKLDMSLRLDDRSSRELRYQYRVRYYPQYRFDAAGSWSLNGFAVTGDEFSSSHNTIDDSRADHFYLRRLYLRKQGDYGKTEFGYIPTYKGRVSSTGLSKDGWLAGLRQVQNLPDGRLELVLGELANVEQGDPFQQFDKLNYIELEYSSEFSGKASYEVSLERMVQSNFFRAEVRYQLTDEMTWAVELIERLDEHKSSIVVGVESTLTVFNSAYEFFGYYNYVSEKFGPRAELTEDFLSTGHGLALEIEGLLSKSSSLDWFAKFEAYKSSTRLQLGLKLSL